MPVPVVTHSPAQMRRIAWSFVMAALAEQDEGLSPAELEALSDQIESTADLSLLLGELVQLAARLWRENHASLADARANAQLAALQLAGS